MKLLTVALFTCLALHSFSATGAEPGAWKNLFDGQTLNGWKQRGGKALYKIEDGAVLGLTVKNTPNSFLCTEKNYADFILEFEFKVDPKLNSGVQIRSECFDQAKTLQNGGKEIKIPAGRVHGYQIEIDPSARAWTAGIYDEGRRGWLNDLKNNPTAGQAFKQDEWNKIRVEAKGDSIKTWINGVPAADLKDGLTRTGFIALQVHGNKEDNRPIRWRNIRIQELNNGP